MTQGSWRIEEPAPGDDGAAESAPTLVTLHYLRRELRRRWRICLTASALGLLAGAAFAYLLPPPSEATVTLFLAHDSSSDPALAMATDVSLLRTRAVAESVLHDEGRFGAVRAMLRREAPRLSSGRLAPETDQLIGATLGLDRSYLAVQGPPGTGKTHNGARMVVAALRAGRRVLAGGGRTLVHRILRKGGPAAGRPPGCTGCRVRLCRRQLLHQAWPGIAPVPSPPSSGSNESDNREPGVPAPSRIALTRSCTRTREPFLRT